MRLLLLLLLMFGSSEEHKFYVSLTDVHYNAENQRLEVASKYFIDDLEMALDIGPDLHITEEMDRNLLPPMRDYLLEHFTVSTSGQACTFELIGYETEDDVVWIYLESDPLEAFTSVTIRGSQLTDLFPDQHNIIHFAKGDKIQSLFLDRSDMEGELLFD